MMKKTGIILITIVILMALAGLIHTPHDPNAMDAAQKLANPTLAHPFGCDEFGRDILSRVMRGLVSTLGISLSVVLIGAAFGSLLGLISGFFGGWLDLIISRLSDILFTMPAMLLALTVIGILGTGKLNLALALGAAFMPSFTRIVRQETVKLKNMDFVSAAKLMGASNFRIMTVHIFPNMAKVFLSSCMIWLNNAVLAESSLSFLGIGIAPPESSLGKMLSDAQGFFTQNPAYVLFPGVVLVCLVLGMSLLLEA